MSLTVTAVGPAHVVVERIQRLASMQMTAFFYLLTYDAAAKVGRFYPGVFGMATYARVSNWGSPTQLDFMRTVRAMDSRLLVLTADGFFQASIWKSPEVDCWAWALEWNKSFRLIGGFGEEVAVRQFLGNVAGTPPLATIPQPDGSVFIIRGETALDPKDDELFVWHETARG